MSSPPDPSPRAESAKYAAALFAGAHGGRVFTDPDTHVVWSVFELDAASVPGAHGRRSCLVFVAEAVVRRVWDYPDAWFLLADADLAAVSLGV